MHDIVSFGTAGVITFPTLSSLWGGELFFLSGGQSCHLGFPAEWFDGFWGTSPESQHCPCPCFSTLQHNWSSTCFTQSTSTFQWNTLLIKSESPSIFTMLTVPSRLTEKIYSSSTLSTVVLPSEGSKSITYLGNVCLGACPCPSLRWCWAAASTLLHRHIKLKKTQKNISINFLLISISILSTNLGDLWV